MHFWKPCLQMVAQTRKTFRSVRKKWNIIIFSKEKIFLSCSSGNLDYSFNNSAESLSVRNRKKIKQKIVFLKIFPWTEVRKNFKSWTFQKKRKIVLSTRKSEFLENQFSSKNVLDTIRGAYSKPRVPMFFLKIFSNFILAPFLSPRRQKKSKRCCASRSQINH